MSISQEWAARRGRALPLTLVPREAAKSRAHRPVL